MKLTTKGRFAVSAILDIALNQKQGPVTLLAVSERQGISLSYLEQLFSKLRRREIVSSIRQKCNCSIYAMARLQF